ncbi:MAG: hypothetical protein V4857_01910 [Pseudomonadota bacterium]
MSKKINKKTAKFSKIQQKNRTTAQHFPVAGATPAARAFCRVCEDYILVNRNHF